MPSSRDERLVYSTGLGRIRICKRCGQPEDACRCGETTRASKRVDAGATAAAAPRDGVVRVALDRKGRGGKAMTQAIGVPGDAATLAELAQTLKRLCGAGGSVKGDTIEIQGDHREKVIERLTALGYKVKRMGG